MIKPTFKLAALIAVVVLFMTSCGGTAESKLVGTWKAQNVETDFDEQFTTPEMLRQVVEMQKETYFKIIDDSTLIIMSPGNTHETSWELDSNDQTISYVFEGSSSFLNKLGTLSDGKIVSESKTPLGVITIYYEKE